MIDNLVIAYRITRRGGHVHEMKQQSGSLDMSQESIAKSVPFVRSFDQARDVGDYKSAEVSHVDDAQMRLERRERIIGNFWPRGRNRGNKRRLACIGKSCEADVGE